MSLSSIMEGINRNLGPSRTAIVLITARHIVSINKIMQNSIDFLNHILFGREHKWEQ